MAYPLLRTFFPGGPYGDRFLHVGGFSDASGLHFGGLRWSRLKILFACAHFLPSHQARAEFGFSLGMSFGSPYYGGGGFGFGMGYPGYGMGGYGMGGYGMGGYGMGGYGMGGYGMGGYGMGGFGLGGYGMGGYGMGGYGMGGYGMGGYVGGYGYGMRPGYGYGMGGFGYPGYGMGGFGFGFGGFGGGFGMALAFRRPVQRCVGGHCACSGNSCQQQQQRPVCQGGGCYRSNRRVTVTKTRTRTRYY